MANNFSQNPFILDTAWNSGTIPAALTDTTKSPQSFRLVEWYNPVTVGDTLIITDINGNVIREAICAVAKQTITIWDAGDSRQLFTLKFGKWILSQISSGQLLMYK